MTCTPVLYARNPIEHLIAYLWNCGWCGGQPGRPPAAADLVLFTGELEDVPDGPFGFRLPNRREYAAAMYQFVGYGRPCRPLQRAAGPRRHNARVQASPFAASADRRTRMPFADPAGFPGGVR